MGTNVEAVLRVVSSRSRVFSASIDELVTMRDKLGDLARNEGYCCYVKVALRDVNSALAIHAERRFVTSVLSGVFNVPEPQDAPVKKRNLRAAEDALVLAKAAHACSAQNASGPGGI